MIDGIRRVLKRQGADEWELPTSMIDVVFLLLIFFLCSSQFRTQEQRLDALLPKHGPNWETPPVERPPVEVLIHVGAHDTAAGLPQFRIRARVMHDANELVALLRQLPRPADYQMVIDGEPNCPFMHLMSALDACARADLTKVSFTPPPAPARS